MPAITRRGPQDSGMSALAAIAAMGGYRPQVPPVALTQQPQVSAVQPVPTSLPTIAPSAGGNILQEGARENTSGIGRGILPWLSSPFRTPGLHHGHRDPATGAWIPGYVESPKSDRFWNAGAEQRALDQENRAMGYSDEANRLAMNQTAQQAEEQRKSAAQAQKNAMESQSASVDQTERLASTNAERAVAAANGMTVEEFRALAPERKQLLMSDIANQQKVGAASAQSAVDIYGNTPEALANQNWQDRMLTLQPGEISYERGRDALLGMSPLNKSTTQKFSELTGAPTETSVSTQGYSIPTSQQKVNAVLQGGGIPGVDLFGTPQAAPPPIPFANPNDAAAAAAVAPPPASAVNVAPGAIPAGYMKRPSSFGELINTLMQPNTPPKAPTPEDVQKYMQGGSLYGTS